MLKKIPVRDVRLGMHLHRLEGSWLDHPFWKTRFTLDSDDDLNRLRASPVPFVWIDDELGVDVAEVVAAEVGAPPSSSRSATAAAPAREPTQVLAHSPAAAPSSDSLAGELARAAAIVKRGRVAVLSMLNEARMGKAVDAEHCLPLVGEITESVWRNPGAIVSLARLKTADDYSFMHSVAVCTLMVALGRQLGLDEAQCRDAGLAGLLHDLGKAAIPLSILNKPGKLTDDEFQVIKTHPVRGHAMLAEARGAHAAALEVCLHHHERPDGKGYPHGLAGDAVTPLARMGAICDVYDAITSNRPYKAAWDPAESIAMMASWKGQFDDTMLQAFVRSLGIYPIGSLVRLASGKLAVVTEQNPAALISPTVKVFFSIGSQMPVRPTVLDLSRPGCSDRIVGRESPAKWGFARLDELWLDPEVLRRSR